MDLGLGHGYSAEVFSKCFEDYTVLDGDEKIISQFRKKHPDLTMEIVHTFFETYEPKRRVDIIIAGFILEHVDDPKEILIKYKNLLNDDGRMFIAVPNGTAMNRQLGYLAGDLPDMTQLSQGDIDLGHQRYFTKDSLSEVVRGSGLSIVKIEGLFLKPITTRQFLTLNFEQKYLDAFLKIGRDYPELSSAILVECKTQ